MLPGVIVPKVQALLGIRSIANEGPYAARRFASWRFDLNDAGA
jgi:hypothetical protein